MAPTPAFFTFVARSHERDLRRGLRKNSPEYLKPFVNRCSHLSMKLMPVKFVPERDRLAAKPSRTASHIWATTGIVLVAPLKRCAYSSDPTKITSGFRLHNGGNDLRHAIKVGIGRPEERTQVLAFDEPQPSSTPETVGRTKTSRDQRSAALELPTASGHANLSTRPSLLAGEGCASRTLREKRQGQTC